MIEEDQWTERGWQPLPNDSLPAKSHYLDADHPGPDVRALCGTQLLGIKVARRVPRCSITCRAIQQHDQDPYG